MDIWRYEKNRWRILSSGLTRIAYNVEIRKGDEHDNIMETGKCFSAKNSAHNNSQQRWTFGFCFVNNLPSLTANIVHMLCLKCAFQKKKKKDYHFVFIIRLIRCFLGIRLREKRGWERKIGIYVNFKMYFKVYVIGNSTHFKIHRVKRRN
jgi:hypothetical protein